MSISFLKVWPNHCEWLCRTLKMAQTTAGDSTQGRQFTNLSQQQRSPKRSHHQRKTNQAIRFYLQAFRGIVAFAICISRMSAVWVKCLSLETQYKIKACLNLAVVISMNTANNDEIPVSIGKVLYCVMSWVADKPKVTRLACLDSGVIMSTLQMAQQDQFSRAGWQRIPASVFPSSK